MSSHFQIDSTDKKILDFLTNNARIAFLEIARECGITGAAIHQRIQKLTNAGVIKGSQFMLNPKGLGYYTCAFIGIQVNLTNPTTHETVFNKIKQIPEVVECHHISGKYSLFVKIFTKSNEHLKKLVIERIQTIKEVTGTETIISLEEGFTRQVPINQGNIMSY